MLSSRRPSTETIRQFLAEQSKLGFTYTAIGATATVAPAGYAVNHTRVKLGEGEKVFAKARAALERWVQFRLGWVEAYPLETQLRTGEVVALIARPFGLWSLNACRIVYVMDEPGRVRQFGFAYGTLPDHAATGEERFLVEWDQASGEVWYDILAFSRPHQLLSRLGYWYMRQVQKRFGRDSAVAMIRAAEGS